MLKGLRTSVCFVDDIQKAKKWYTKVLGKEPYFSETFYVGFNVGGFELGLHPSSAESKPGKGGTVAYWGVENAKEAHQILIDMGAKAAQPVEDVGGNIMIGSVIDPFGNELGVIENPHFKFEG